MIRVDGPQEVRQYIADRLGDEVASLAQPVGEKKFAVRDLVLALEVEEQGVGDRCFVAVRPRCPSGRWNVLVFLDPDKAR